MQTRTYSIPLALKQTSTTSYKTATAADATDGRQTRAKYKDWAGQGDEINEMFVELNGVKDGA